MEFSKSSWHYKLVSKFYGAGYFYNYELEGEFDKMFTGDFPTGIKPIRKNISLCKYFWSVVLATVLTGLYMPVKYLIVMPLSFAITGLASVLPSVDIDVNLPKISYKTRDRIGKIMVISLLGVLGGLVIYGLLTQFLTTITYIIEIAFVTGAYVGIRLLLDEIHRRKLAKKKIKQPDNPNLVKEFVKAKKSKICPIITFRDDFDDKEDLK